MKKYVIISGYLLATILISCNEKKLTEVVEVPLPTTEEKRIIGLPDDVVANEGSFSLQKLPYNYEALAPHIDPLTMETHYSKHYLAYTNALNKAILNTEFDKLTIEEILAGLNADDSALRNNAGGFYNHGIFFDNLTPKAAMTPQDSFMEIIVRDFGSFEDFKKQFIEEANKQFGSAWTWLIVDNNGKLVITSTANQDNPLMSFAVVKGTPILALDLWEHAYYLNYQQNRKNYINAFFNIINWVKVQNRFESALDVE